MMTFSTGQRWKWPGRKRRASTGPRWLLLLVMLVAWPLGAAERPLVMVLGDSLSAAYGIEQDAGWVSLLHKRLGDKAEVINASISGETTSGGATRLPGLLRQHAADIVLLELGGNDGLRGLPPTQMRDNLDAMIEASQAAGARVLLVGIDIPPNYGEAYRRAFRGVFEGLAQRHDLTLVPFLLEGLLEDAVLDPELMQDDGIHPTAAAQPRLLETVWPSLEPLLEREGVACDDRS